MPWAVTPTIPQLRILTCVLSPFAVVVTLLRLWIRRSHGKLWWDDLWVAISAFITAVFVLVFMLHIRDPATNPMTQSAKIAVYYFCPLTFYAVAWTSRISILFTVIRLSFALLRKLLIAAAGFFFFCLLLLSAQVFWVCETQPGWKDTPLAQCDLGRQVAITLIVMDVICDTILIAAPLSLLWGSRLQRGLKFRLIAVFASTAIMTGVSLYHDYSIYLFGGLEEAFAANLQVSVSLMVANLSVITAVLFRAASEQSQHTSNKTPLGIATFGGGTNNRRGRAPTFGAIDTMMPDDDPHIKVQVDISQVDDSPQMEAWESDMDSKVPAHDHGGARVEKIELRQFPPSAAQAV
ncbi:hypothetical protein FB45DRAFT_215804 [Roridomyces roridus]|uniref:Rhodopsin domain-containing protein n=1 Tax=Roridomyces roridus TaxID=1738132 RepID=A0AAD7FG07_9AGAR|nr:hypothetical protein FB45DRAFT_215804 [Roridomyces roridus]